MLKIYNSLTRKKELFQPIEENYVRMYVCGMTVYDYCHIGHGRTITCFDIIARYFTEKKYKVTYVRNITDIDDKIIRRAQENNEPFDSLTIRMIQSMQADFQALQNIAPNQEPKATAYVDDMIQMINELISKDYAYNAENGDVYFRVKKFSRYGQLSGKILDDLEAGSRVEINNMKESPLDFTLWKQTKEGEPSWLSPWGEGRPGWHIECSVMCRSCLGETFDIHGGGADLVFPHHENEIAQSEAANEMPYAKLWMHTGAIRINEIKMSKSLNNYLTIRDILKEYHPEQVRFFFISSHYRSPLNYTENGLRTAGVKLERLYQAIESLDFQHTRPSGEEFEKRFFIAMDDDFNTPEAIAVLFDLVRVIHRTKKKSLEETLPLAALLSKLGNILGILQHDAQVFLQSGITINADWVESNIAQRQQAKKDKNFLLADKIRATLLEKGVS